jgi:MFS family permease
MSDKVGAIRAQQASLTLGGFGFFVLSGLRQRWSIAVAMLLVSVVVEAFRPAAMTAFAERSSREIRPKAFAFLRLAVNLGVGIGPAVGGFLALYGYRYIFYTDAATCWLAALLLLKLRVAPKATPNEMKDPRRRSGRPWGDPAFLLLLGLVIVMASVLFQIFSTFPLYLHEYIGLRENAIGLVLALNAMLIVLFEMPLIHVVQNRDRMRLIGLGAFLLSAGFSLLPLGSAPAFLALTVAVWTFGEMLALPVLNVVVAERASAGYEGQYMGLYTMAFAIAFVLAPVAGTFFYERFGPDILWLTIGAIGVVLWTGVARLAPAFRASPEEPD